ncbi:hypothetical protein BgiMline_002627 [Biomphalaria glabrata]|nr:hypothetical protein BgiMline_011238 [Biomphalaria glabrata]
MDIARFGGVSKDTGQEKLIERIVVSERKENVSNSGSQVHRIAHKTYTNTALALVSGSKVHRIAHKTYTNTALALVSGSKEHRIAHKTYTNTALALVSGSKVHRIAHKTYINTALALVSGTQNSSQNVHKYSLSSCQRF